MNNVTIRERWFYIYMRHVYFRYAEWIPDFLQLHEMVRLEQSIFFSNFSPLSVQRRFPNEMSDQLVKQRYLR